MPVRATLLSEADIAALRAWPRNSQTPFQFPWPMPGKPDAWLSFESFDQWLEKVTDLTLNEAVPRIVSGKYERAQKLLLLAWIDFDLAIAAQLVALTTLELAVTDVYGAKADEWAIKTGLKHKPKKKKKKKREDRVETPDLATKLKYMVAEDQLTDAKIAMNRRCGAGSVIGLLTGDTRPTLAEIRNDHAHGYPFDAMPRSGLIELIRDLIEYAYRDRIATPRMP